MSTVVDVIDEILEELTPDGSYTDDSLARPVEYEPDRLYGWPLAERFDPEGTGEMDTDTFTVRLAWATPATDEVAAAARDRETTLLLAAFVDATQAWVRGHRSGTAYEHLQVAAVDWESVTTHQVRGVLVDLTGYQLLS